MIYPCDAITKVFTIPANGNLVILPANPTSTILNVYLNVSGYTSSTQGYVNCGSEGIAWTGYGSVMNKDIRDYTYKCSKEIKGYNTSPTTGVGGHIVYVNRDIALTPATCDFSSGEVVNGFFLFTILLGLFLAFIVLNWIGIRIKRKA